MQWRGLKWRRQASCSAMAAAATATVQRSTASIRRPAIRCGKAVPPIAKTYTMHSRLRGARSTTGAIADTASAKRCCVRTRRSEEHTSELQSLMRISYAVFCLKKNNRTKNHQETIQALLRYYLHKAYDTY